MTERVMFVMRLKEGFEAEHANRNHAIRLELPLHLRGAFHFS